MSLNTSGQFVKTNKKLTAEEIKAVQKIATTFNKTVNETGDISTIIDELFIPDFFERLVKARKKEISQNIKKYRPEFFDPNKVSFVTYLYFKSDLLDTAPIEEWKRLYVSTFNFNHFQTILYCNDFAKIENRGEKYEIEDLMNIEHFYPANLLELFDNHPNLKGFIRLKVNSEPIKTVEELRSVNETLETGLKLLNEGKKGKPAIELSEESKKLNAKLKVRPYFGETVETNFDDFFGFIAGTRFIIVWLSPGRKLYIVKVKGEHKIILKPFP